MAAKRHLGRGLSALLGEEAEQSPPTAPVGGARLIAIDRLRPGRFQPRENFDSERMEQLAQSIRERGVLQPILVRPLSEADDFEIVAGERRWRAAQLALQHEVPVIVRELSDRDALEIALIENIQRQDLNPIEEGLAYRRLLEEFRYSQEELARHIGKSRPHIANTIRLLELPEAVRRMVIEGRLTAGHARPLIGQPNALELAAKIVKGGLSVRAAEALAKAASAPGRKTAKAQAGAKKKDADTRALEHDLTMRLGLKVEIDFDGKGGRLSIEYKTLDQLDDLIRKLSA
jgi:ParB family chromosome partitioning protein